jgi:hypothetical protein
MNKILILILAVGGYYYYDQHSKSQHERVFDVANNPMSTDEYIGLWERKAIEMCKVNAKDYNIDIRLCPAYITEKFPKCKSKLPSPLPKVIDSKKLGSEVIADYFSCISPWPHCKGQEIISEFEYRQYCTEV